MAVQEKFDIAIRAQDEASNIIKRINNELQSTTQSIAALNSAFAASAGAAAPLHQVGTAFKAAGKSATDASLGFAKADLKMVALGSNLSGLPPAVAQVVSAFAFGSPIIAGVTLGIGLLTSALFESESALTTYSDKLGLTNDALGKLATTTGLIGDKARQTRDLRLAELKAEEAVLQEKISSIDVNKTVAQEYDRLGGITQEQTRLWNEQRMQADNLRITYDDLNARLVANRNEQGKLSEGTVVLTNDIEKLIAANDAWNRSLMFGSGESDWLTRDPQADIKRLQDANDRWNESLQPDEMDWMNGPATQMAESEAQALQAAMQKWQEFSSVVMSSTDQLAGGITDMFFGLRDSLAEIFKEMAANWLKYFINEIIKQTALRLGFALFSAIFPGSGGLLSAAGGAGGGDVGVLDGLTKPGTGVDIVSSGAKRFGGRGAGPASVSITIAGDVIGDQEYVNRKIIPAIEQAVAYGQSKIQVR